MDPNLSLFSNKQIITSSMPIRERVMSVNLQADELSQKIEDFKQRMQNDVVYNNLKTRDSVN